jgi:hypothetical protein
LPENGFPFGFFPEIYFFMAKINKKIILLILAIIFNELHSKVHFKIYNVEFVSFVSVKVT